MKLWVVHIKSVMSARIPKTTGQQNLTCFLSQPYCCNQYSTYLRLVCLECVFDIYR